MDRFVKLFRGRDLESSLGGDSGVGHVLAKHSVTDVLEVPGGINKDCTCQELLTLGEILQMPARECSKMHAKFYLTAIGS